MTTCHLVMFTVHTGGILKTVSNFEVFSKSHIESHILDFKTAATGVHKLQNEWRRN